MGMYPGQEKIIQATIDDAIQKGEAALFAAIAELKRDDWRASAMEARKALAFLERLEGEVGKLY